MKKIKISKIQMIIGMCFLVLLIVAVVVFSLAFNQNVDKKVDNNTSEIFSNETSVEEVATEQPTQIVSNEKTSSQGSTKTSNVPNKEPSSAAVENKNAPKKNHDNTYYANYVQKDKSNWTLRLMNLSNIDPSFSPATSSIATNRLFDTRAAKSAKDMIKACNDEGISLWPQSTFRSVADQEKIHQKYVTQEMNAGYSKEDAVSRVRKYSMPGGASDHNLGLAIDFNTITMDFKNTAGYKWMIKNAEKYGFV
ncbi:MAG: D-alanyl-D-alanine carboxypeptidase family protein, partial [Oscillospiraceae bacterium]